MAGSDADAAVDVLVVGGGIIGLASAWRARRRGLSVTVLDPDPGRGANQVAAGMLAPVTELQYGEEPLLRLGLESNARYAEFAAELAEASGGMDLGYRRCGTLAVALDADDRAELREVHAFQRRLGLDAEWLTGRECRRLEPMLAPGVRGGLLARDDHQVDGRRLGAALTAACERSGVVIDRARAAELTYADGTDGTDGADGADAGGERQVVGARTGDGRLLRAGQTVLAAGSRSGELYDGLPVRPVKGQVLRLRMDGPFAGFLGRNVRAVVRGVHIYLVPRENGELVIGATTEERGWDTTVTAGGVYELLRDAHELVPGITELPLAETGAGLRPGSPDNAPMIGPTGVPGLVAATGHGRNGVLLTAVTGELVAELLATGRVPELAAPFSPTRFRRPESAEVRAS
ncbi:glycine oxidase ThiO [Phaeacidiphilus oryzae]|uniref:glycine oxidase ThiO n=1 Tax=Phaeacidiphilus oryzae TaxID=348818 RepID=UPI0005613EE7|nr:glycine oxidase ThiO [Phaeacidiphilus oryzae]